MSNIKKKISIFIIIFLFLVESNAAIKDSLFATVGDKAITRSDIIREIKIILILGGQSYDESKKDQIDSTAIQSVINRKIKLTEIEKYNFSSFNSQDLNNELKQYAENLDMDLVSLKNIFETNEIDFSNIILRVKTELLWNGLIFQLYKDRLSININEINDQLELIQDKKEIEEYLISEIIAKPVPSNELKSKIDKIKKKISTDGFENTARDISIAESALNGGDLGWVNENVISSKFRSKIINTPIGSLSEPILLPEGILIFKVRDKKKLKTIVNLEDAKDQLVNAEKTKLLNMHSLSHFDNLKRSISINYFYE